MGNQAKENMDSTDYHVLEEIGLLDDIPGALCVIASLKPGVHEEGQQILSQYFHVPLTGGHKPKDVKANNNLKRSYEVVGKVWLRMGLLRLQDSLIIRLRCMFHWIELDIGS